MARLTYRGAVYPWHCDHMGHMNVMWYVGKMDEASMNLFAAIGVTRAYMRETQFVGRGLLPTPQRTASAVCRARRRRRADGWAARQGR
jgi:acyl-CoA thioester hydrolase